MKVDNMVSKMIMKKIIIKDDGLNPPGLTNDLLTHVRQQPQPYMQYIKKYVISHSS